MRLAAICREAIRDLHSGTSRAALWCGVWIVVTLLLCLTELIAVRTAVHAAQDYRESGAATLILVATGRIDGQPCEALADLPDVHGAGALRRSATDLRALALPGSSIPRYDATVGWAPTLGVAQDPAGGVLISDQVANALGLAVGERVGFRAAGSTTVAGIYRYPDDGRRAGLGYAVITPALSAGPFDECWVDAWPIPTELGSLMRGTLRPGSAETDAAAAVTLTQLNTSRGTSFTGGRDYADRITRFAPVAALIAGLVLGWISIRSRRVQLAKRPARRPRSVSVESWSPRRRER